MKNHIAIYHTWPELKNAEFENILRIVHAAKNVGIHVTVVDNQGYALFSTDASMEKGERRLDRQDCDFAISLHFESPKLNDWYTYSALWNPLDFYFAWGYEKTIRQLVTHDDFLSCDSDATDAHALNLLQGLSRMPKLPLPNLHHSLSGEVIAPKLTRAARVFYIGINWEKINNSRGRHHDLLVALDKADMIDIYGPELFHGVMPWEGFDSYRGSIAFDGKTTISKIAEAGICLAFSSASHQRSGVMSNRLFEGLAAGALVIANKHPFLDKFFGDLIPTVDDTLPAEQVISAVKEIVRWARSHPEEASGKALAAQKIFCERFALERSLKNLMVNHAERVSHWRKGNGPARSVSAIVLFTDLRFKSLERTLSALAGQSHPISKVLIVLDESWYGLNNERVTRLIQDLPFAVKFEPCEIYRYEGDLDRHTSRRSPLGPAVWATLRRLDTDFFLLLKPEEELFSNHVETLVAALEQDSSALAAMSGVILESYGSERRLERRLEYLSPKTTDFLIYANETRYAATTLYRSALKDACSPIVFDLCDGQEHNYLNALAYQLGSVCWSYVASYVLREYESERSILPILTAEQQHQFIRDALRGSIERPHAPTRLLDGVVVTNVGGGHANWGSLRRPSDIGALLTPDVIYEFQSSGNGLPFLGSGYSHLEENGVWINGRSANLEFSLNLTEKQLGDLTKVRFIFSLQGRSQQATKRRQHATVQINGAPVAYIEISDAWAYYHVHVKGQLFEGQPQVRIRFNLDHAELVMDADGNIVDNRIIGMKIGSVIAHIN